MAAQNATALDGIKVDQFLIEAIKEVVSGEMNSLTVRIFFLIIAGVILKFIFEELCKRFNEVKKQKSIDENKIFFEKKIIVFEEIFKLIRRGINVATVNTQSDDLLLLAKQIREAKGNWDLYLSTKESKILFEFSDMFTVAHSENRFDLKKADDLKIRLKKCLH